MSPNASSGSSPTCSAVADRRIGTPVAEVPLIKAVMTPFPYFVETRASLAEARDLMTSHGVHHLPVKEGHDLIGLLGDPVLARALSSTDHRHPNAVSVGDLELDATVVVDLHLPLDAVLDEMAERRVGAALVVKDHRLAGIFTVHDACRCFSDLLCRRFPHGGDDAA